MFSCERCGSSFSPIRVASGEACPRCRARDGVEAPLAFAPFSSPGVEAGQPPVVAEESRGDDAQGTAS